MSRDLYTRKMYESPIYLLLLIPLGVLLIIFACNFGYTKYFKAKLYKDAEDVFRVVLDTTSLQSEVEMQNYIKQKLIDKGYEKDELKIVIVTKEDYKILIVYADYYSIIDSLITKNSKVTSVKLKGYYNEFKETIVEEYDEDVDDLNLDKIEEDKDLNNIDDITEIVEQ